MGKISIFVSYSHEDSMWVQEGPYVLIPWLVTSLQRENVAFWYDPALKTLPGVEYREKIRKEIEKADFAVLLISQDFINSDFVRQFELPLIKARVERGELSIIPILVSYALWTGEADLHWLTERQMLPGKPTPLVDYISDLAKWKRVRIEILEAMKNSIREKRGQANCEEGVVKETGAVPGIGTKQFTPAPQNTAVAAVSPDLRVEKCPQLAAEEGKKKESPTSGGAAPTKEIIGKDDTPMVLIPAGEFWMGSPDGEGHYSEHPRHKVYLDAYSIDKYEVTVQQYKRYCEETGMDMPFAPSWGWQDDHPVVNVTWDDATAYAAWAGKRLLTEAEWEKTCRVGSETTYCYGDVAARASLGDYAWYVNNSGRQTHPVGQKKPNIWGLYDMLGNVFEWCSDWYGDGYYTGSPNRNPTGPESGQKRVLRGGSWGLIGDFCRSGNRCWGNPSDRGHDSGFRCARSAGS